MSMMSTARSVKPTRCAPPTVTVADGSDNSMYYGSPFSRRSMRKAVHNLAVQLAAEPLGWFPAPTYTYS
jgi:hypothetical protein